MWISAPNETWYSALKRENESLKRTTADLQTLFDLLQSTPEAIATEALRQLRNGKSPQAVVQLIKGYKRPRTPSPQDADQADGSLSATSFEIELIALHPAVYPSLPTIDASQVDLRLLGLPLASLIRPKQTKRFDIGPLMVDGVEPYLESTSPGEVDPRTLDPTLLSADNSFLPPKIYVDDRLKLVDIRRWTSVPVNNHFAAGAMSLYLSNDHPILGLFDADLFLDDLTTGNTRFCSRLLVNALFCCACQSYTRIEPASAAFLYRFFDEAEQLWQEEEDRDSLPYISAAMFLTFANSTIGRDKVGTEFLQEAFRAANSMGLFDEPDDEEPDVEDDMQAATSHVAWAAFNFLSWVAFSC